MFGEPKRLVNPRCAIYCRVSTEDQAHHGTSLESQHEDCLKYVRNLEGATVNERRHIYVDDGLSGTTDNRPEFLRMIQDAKNGEFDLIVVKRLDRLFRKISLASKYLELLDKNKVKIHSISESFDTSTIAWKVMFELLSVFAGLEANLIRDRTVHGKRKRSKDWFFVGGGMPPYGYGLEDRKLFIKEDEAAVVRKIFQLYAREGKGVSEISEILTAEGKPIRSMGRKDDSKKSPWAVSTKWSGSFIYKILSNTMYYGRYYYGKHVKEAVTEEVDWTVRTYMKNRLKPIEECVDFDCPRILGESDEEALEIFNAAAKIREENRKAGKFGDYAFSWKIKCDITGFTYVWSRNRHWTICYKIHKSKSKPNFDKKIGVQILEEELVEMVIEFLREMVGVPSSKLEDFIREKVLKSDRTQHLSEEVFEIDKRVSEIQSQIDRLTAAFAEVWSLGDDFKKKAVELWNQRNVLLERKAEKEEALRSIERTAVNIAAIRNEFKDFKSRLSNLPYEVKRELAKSITERVYANIDRHYRFELRISEDIRKYFDWPDDSQNGVGWNGKPKNPSSPSWTSSWTDKHSSKNSRVSDHVWSQESWGSNIEWVSNQLFITTNFLDLEFVKCFRSFWKHFYWKLPT